jgi:hypothetical protein
MIAILNLPSSKFLVSVRLLVKPLPRRMGYISSVHGRVAASVNRGGKSP